MEPISILRESALAELRRAVDGDEEWIAIYREEAEFPFVDADKLVRTTIRVVGDPPDLTVDGSSKIKRAADDAANAARVYAYLGELDRTQAADPRLWATLTHTVFWSYAQRRWPVMETDLEKAADFIYEHWFETSGKGLAALRRNAVSRLWWAARLTVAPWERDPELEVFKTADRERFTRILLSQQQVYFDVIERSFGSNLRLRICLLDALDRGLASVSKKDDLSKGVAKKVNLLLRHRELDALSVSELRPVLNSVVDSVETQL